jgi:hypothetical protein
MVELVESQNSAEGRFMVQLSEDQLSGSQTELTFEVYSGEEKLETVTSGSLGPANNFND